MFVILLTILTIIAAVALSSYLIINTHQDEITYLFMLTITIVLIIAWGFAINDRLEQTRLETVEKATN